jgi:hypothetical protein
MPIFLNPRGRSTFGLGICARCSRKMFLEELFPDPNSPGLMVCRKDRDTLDPYRLPARQTERITLPFNRPDLPLTDPTPIPAPILAGNLVGGHAVLTWTESFLPYVVSKYLLYRKTKTGSFVQIASIYAGETLTYTDTPIPNGDIYTYYVVADGAIYGSPDQLSSPSNMVSFSGAINAFLSQVAFLPGVGYAAAGIFRADSTSAPVVRFASTANGLATAADIAIPSTETSLNACFALGGLFIVADTVGGIWSSSDGTTWTQANNVGADWPTGNPNGGVYDGVNNKIVLITSTNNVITATPGPGALNFVSHTWGTDADHLVSIGYRPGSGIVNAITGSGGTTHGNTYQSTNGGTSWVKTNNEIFGGINNSFEIAYTGFDVSTIWSAFGGDVGGVLCNSHGNDGGSWTAPASWGGPTTPGVIKLDNSGNTVFAPIDGTVWLSTDAGQTWTQASGIPANDGTSSFCLTWDQTAGLWSICLLSPDDSSAFFVTSPDLVTWTQGPNITD